MFARRNAGLAHLLFCCTALLPITILLSSPELWGQQKPSVTEGAFDQMTVDHLLASRNFRNRSIAIYRIGGGLNALILQRFAREDSLSLHRYDSLCAKAAAQPIPNCFGALQSFMVSRSAPDYHNARAFARAFAEKLEMEENAVDAGMLQEMCRAVLDIRARRQSRADHFYLVTTRDVRPRVIAIAEAREGADGFIRHVSGIPLRRWLADIHPDAESRLLAQLANASATQAADNELKMLWPATNVAVQQGAPAMDILDIKAIRMIRGREEFAGEFIAIYELQEDAAALITERDRRSDSLAMAPVEALCAGLYAEPLPDAAATVRELVSSPRTEYGSNRAIFRLALAQKYNIDPAQLNDAVLGVMLDSVRAINARRHVRPWFIQPHYYLITTDDALPQPIGMVWINEELSLATSDSVENLGPGRLTFGKVVTGDDFHGELSAIDPGAESMLLHRLAGAPKESSPFEEIDLVNIWPRKRLEQ